MLGGGGDSREYVDADTIAELYRDDSFCRTWEKEIEQV